MSTSTGQRAVNIGKRGERGAVRALRTLGFTNAERRKAGRFHDALDLDIAPGVIGSVKSGEYAKSASLARVIEWRDEAERKRVAEGAALCLLIVQRKGHGPDRAATWRCWVLGAGMNAWESTLEVACAALREKGWGEAA